METINNWKDVTMDSLSGMGNEIGQVFPKIIGAIVVLVVGWLFIKIDSNNLQSLVMIFLVLRNYVG